MRTSGKSYMEEQRFHLAVRTPAVLCSSNGVRVSSCLTYQSDEKGDAYAVLWWTSWPPRVMHRKV